MGIGTTEAVEGLEDDPAQVPLEVPRHEDRARRLASRILHREDDAHVRDRPLDDRVAPWRVGRLGRAELLEQRAEAWTGESERHETGADIGDRRARRAE